MSVFHIPGKNAIVRANEFPTFNGVQTFNWDPSFNEEYLNELGNEFYAGQSLEMELSATMDMTSVGGTVSNLNRMVMDVDANGLFLGDYLYDGTVGQENIGTLRGTDLEYAIFDLVVAKKANTAWDRSEFFPRLHLASVNFTADANGNATESYSMEGQLADVYRAPYQDLISVPAAQTSSTAATLTTTTKIETPAGAVVTTPTHTAIALFVNDEVLLPDTDFTLDDTFGIAAVGAVTFPAGARMMLLAHADTAGAFPTVFDPLTPDFMRGDQIDLFLVDKSTVDIDGVADGSLNAQAFNDSDRFLRVQSFDLTIDMQREVLRQISRNDTGTSIYYRAPTFPLNVTASCSTIESDLAAWVAFQNGNATPSSATDTLDLEGFRGKQTQLVARYYNSSATVMQTMVLGDARVSGMSRNVAAGGRAEVTWNLTGSDWRLEGSDG